MFSERLLAITGDACLAVMTEADPTARACTFSDNTNTQTHWYDREGTRRARVCPQHAGNTVVRASEGDRQHEPKRACPGNTFHALTCVIFVPSARYYMRSEATIREVMLPLSRLEAASQGAKDPEI